MCNVHIEATVTKMITVTHFSCLNMTAGWGIRKKKKLDSHTDTNVSSSSTTTSICLLIVKPLQTHLSEIV